jgi:DNA repair protein RadC
MYLMARAEDRRAFIPVMRELRDEELVSVALGCSAAEAAALLAHSPLETLSRSHSSRESDVRLLACVEVGRRARYRAAAKQRPLRTSADVKKAFRRLQDAVDEEFWCVYLDARGVPLEERLIARGAPNEVSVNLRAIVAHALRIGAVSIIVVHNHPSGDPTPSEPDIDLTDSLERACETVDLRFLDHVIVAGRRSHSFAGSRQLGVASARRSAK